MSRELLKRALDELDVDRDTYGTLCKEIETYLAKPDPEPVAWMVENHPEELDTFVNFTPNFNSHFEKLCCKVTPLYTTTPDQSARITELELALARANADIESLEDRLIVKNQRLYEYNEKITSLERQVSPGNDMQLALHEGDKRNPKLAAMRAKLEPLSDDKIAGICAECAASAHQWDDLAFARAIEQAHGIGVNHE